MPWLFTCKRGTCRMEAIMAYGKSEGRRIVNGKWIVSFFADNTIRVEDEWGCAEGMSTYTEVRHVLNLQPLFDAEGYRIERVPCPDCRGEGKHSQHLGVINHDEWEDEELDRYFSGKYDRTCRGCGGQGTVDVHVQCHLTDDFSTPPCNCEDCISEARADMREAAAVYRAESGLGWDW